MKKLDSRVVVLNNRRYKVYLKNVKVKANNEGSNGLKERAFVKRL